MTATAGRYLASRSPLIVAWLLACLAFWPSHMSADSFYMLQQAQGEIPINDQHAPILLWLWKLVWPLGVGVGWILALQIGTFLVGAYLIARVGFGPLGASLTSSLVMLSPPVLGGMGLLGRDTWYLSLSVLAFGLLALAHRGPEPLRRRSLIGVLVVGFFCLAVRQNALTGVAVAFAIATAMVLGPRLASRGPVMRLVIVSAVGGGLALTLALSQVVIVRAAGVKQNAPEQQLFLFDLALMSEREGRSLIPRSVFRSGDVEVLAAQSTLDGANAMFFGPTAATPVPHDEQQLEDIQEAWRTAILDHPWTYLGVRWDAWLRQLAVTRAPTFIYHPGIDPNTKGYAPTFMTLNRALLDYQKAFTSNEQLDGRWPHRPFVYLLLAMFAAAYLLRRGGASSVVGWLAVTAWTYQLGLFVLAMIVNYRYELPAVATGLLCAVVAAKIALDDRRGGRSVGTATLRA
ncbi:hypothetical protein GKE82_18595 [Conexibacter sp. W3-3-2]|uniref:hypothetical protein n=1 Tax=Conexibacter sp. W3-3-2 TaxID=2675227 RepID=UPI0012B83053|nr:hypothetical protein [Conexibacter sp. W3-3-2]MTD46242.1 hypothetical protein [Conexibacter sp. W3-3-2]